MRAHPARISLLHKRTWPVAALIVLILVCAGVYYFAVTKAATPWIAKEAEDGAAASMIVSDTSASGGKAVKFASSTTAAPFDIGTAYGGNADPAPLEAAWGAKLESRRTYFGPADTAANGKAVKVVKADIAAGRKTSSISFKLPATWAEMAAGSQDAWAQTLATNLADAIRGTDHQIRIALHHEPENDKAPNDGATVAGRDAWKNMQARMAPFFDKPNIQYVAILMGYHTFYGSANMKALWNLDAAIPTNSKIKGIGFDIYQGMGVDGKTKWTDMNAYFVQIGSWTRAHNMTWGLSETGIAASAFSERPTYFTDTIAQMKAQGGSWFETFNSNLNSPDPKWSFTADEQRGQAFGQLLRTERAN